ncbi:MAG: DUF6249 domain-containing protein [Bacteroidia bacterium]|nr:DUF6249 domain-containing protein [Bacteroidia bacterium]
MGESLRFIAPIVALITVGVTVFGIIYLYVTARHKERMALIEHNRTAGIFSTNPNDTFRKRSRLNALKYGLIIFGLGIGLIMGFVLSKFGMPEELSILAMMLVCGGLGLMLYYRLTEKEEDSTMTQEEKHPEDVFETMR